MVALCQQIAQAVRADIARGRYKIGDRLPTIHDLMKKWNAGGIQTVRSAYLLLIEQGLVEARHGKGYFLRRIPPTTVTRMSDQLLFSVQCELLRIAIRTGKSLRGLSSQLPEALAGAHQLTVEWIAAELGPGATRHVHDWELRDNTPIYHDGEEAHILRADGTWVAQPDRWGADGSPPGPVLHRVLDGGETP